MCWNDFDMLSRLARSTHIRLLALYSRAWYNWENWMTIWNDDMTTWNHNMEWQNEMTTWQHGIVWKFGTRYTACNDSIERGIQIKTLIIQNVRLRTGKNYKSYVQLYARLMASWRPKLKALETPRNVTAPRYRWWF